MNPLNELKSELANTCFITKSAMVIESTETYIKTKGPNVPMGSVFEDRMTGERYEVLKSKKGENLLMPLEGIVSVKAGDFIVPSESILGMPKNPKDLVGRIIDGFGRPLDNEKLKTTRKYKLNKHRINPLERRRVDENIETGIKSIDGLLTIGRGQKIGIFSGTGVGKTTLLGMLAREAKEEINVIALIGERGREVREFIERDLGEEGLKRSVLVVATSDESPLMQIRAAELATSISELFRNEGKNVLLMMDSITRYLMSKRIVDIASGEVPLMGGKTMSMEPSLQRLLERSGNSKNGSITGIYTVLVEGDDFDSPIPDMARGILDGHIVLTRRLADNNHFPAIDILSSISRVMNDIVDEKHLKLAREFKKYISIYNEIEDQISLGMIEKGQNQEIDKSIKLNKKLNNFLKQEIEENYSFGETLSMMEKIIV